MRGMGNDERETDRGTPTQFALQYLVSGRDFRFVSGERSSFMDRGYRSNKKTQARSIAAESANTVKELGMAKASHHRKAQEIPRSSEIDTDALCCPRCRSKLRPVSVSADMASFPKTLGIVPSGPTEVIGAVIENGGDTLRLEAIEKRTILTAVREAGNKKILAARMLGIGRTTLYRKLKDYDFDEDISVRQKRQGS